MTHKVYRQNAKIMIRKGIRFFERIKREKNTKKINKIEKEDNDVLKLEITELGVVPTEFISRKIKINLYSLLDPKKENPYEDIFDTLKKYFNEKGSSINAEYIGHLCADSKKFMVEHGVSEDAAYFFEKRKNLLISLDNF